MDGTGQARLTSEPANDLQPAWSPTAPASPSSAPRRQRGDLDHGRDGERGRPLTDSPDQQRRPAWSPDGRFIAFDTNAEEARPLNEVYRMNADGSAETNLTVTIGRDDYARLAQPVRDAEGPTITITTP